MTYPPGQDDLGLDELDDLSDLYMDDACAQCGLVHTDLADDEWCSEMQAERDEEEAEDNERARRECRP